MILTARGDYFSTPH